MNHTEKHNIVITRVFDASVAEVWKAWSDPEYVKQWWGPTGFTCPVAEIDFRVGGTSLVCMRASAEFGGQDYYNTWTYEEIVPLQRFVYMLHFADKDGNRVDPADQGLPPEMPKAVRNEVAFKPLGSDQMELTVTEYDWSAGQMMEMSEMGMNQCLDKMATLLQAGDQS